jgi:UDP-N-acetylglucosamine transferase subunit ALG13
VILVTIGTQLPFDRLVAAMDNIAGRISEPVFAQIGHTSYVPRNLDWAASLAPAEFDRHIAEARLVVSHAGTGSILAAQRHRLPIILMPRRADLGEHRNDHQLATAARLQHKRGLYVAHDETELEALIRRSDLQPAAQDGDLASRQQFVGQLRAFLAA